MHVRKKDDNCFLIHNAQHKVMSWHDLYIFLMDNVKSPNRLKYFYILSKTNFMERSAELTKWNGEIIFETEEQANLFIDKYNALLVMEKLCISKK